MGPKGMSGGGKMKMVTNDKGQEVPHFAADGQGKMAGGGKTRVANKMMPKGYFKGGRTMKNKMDTKGGAKGGGMRGGGRTNNKMNTKGGKMGGKG